MTAFLSVFAAFAPLAWDLLRLAILGILGALAWFAAKCVMRDVIDRAIDEALSEPWDDSDADPEVAVWLMRDELERGDAVQRITGEAS